MRKMELYFSQATSTTSVKSTELSAVVHDGNVGLCFLLK
jgi:hypothetical protein